MATSASRVKDQGQNCEASILLIVSVESLALKDNDKSCDSENVSNYIETVLKLYEAIRYDYDNVLMELNSQMAKEYDMKALRPVQIQDMEGSLVFEGLLPKSRLVAIQCDLSGGRLAKRVQKTLITDKILKSLSAADISLVLELKSL